MPGLVEIVKRRMIKSINIKVRLDKRLDRTIKYIGRKFDCIIMTKIDCTKIYR